MGYLYYTELGNKGGYDVNGNLQSGSGLTNTGPFKNLQYNEYWSGTTYAADPTGAWAFGFFGDTRGGGQGLAWNGWSYTALAVYQGDVAAPTPIPGTVWLFGSGLLGIIGLSRKFST